ncbi:methyltransferase domain-containing protein [Phenylobacterium sp.]|uniref:class I SAM-dependent methyltransferase n=1 Tax=Phenylobacterium sp. TaxID=1871053 RepID=UPI00301D6B47
MAKAKPYYAPGSLSAAHYDAVTAADARLAGDEDIYAGLAPAGGSMLELGAGSGRLTCGLALRGFEVTGVDIAPAMLAQAQARVAALPDDVRRRVALVRGDMTALDLKRTFDLVFLPFFTLAHAPAGAAWRNTFKGVARHMAAGAVAAVHLPRLDLMRRPPPANPGLPVMDLPTPDGRLLLFVRERTFREGVNRLDQVLEYALTDARGRIVRKSSERLTYYMADPVPPAAEAGLEPDRDPINVGDVGDVWVFRRASA